ncbi:MAG: immunoglobulin domain-containing protein, partial [Candidatus Dormibacteraceae bacterium]
ILAQPSSQTNFEATPVTFTVKAGLGSLSFQWMKNGTNIPGATDATLFIPEVRTQDAGNYSVAIHNSIGSVVSAAAYLAVRIRPSLVMNGFYRGQAVLSVSAQHCLRVIIEASSDLQSWTPLRTNSIGLDGFVSFGFQDPDSQSLGARFYRVRQE